MDKTAMRKRVPLTPERIALLRACPAMKVADAIEIYQVGRNKIYAYLHEGRLSCVKLGASTLINVESLEKLVGAE